MSEPVAPRHVAAELVASKRAGAHRLLTFAAPGVPEGFRPGAFVTLSVGERTTRRAFWIHRVRQTSSVGPTLDVVVEPQGWGSSWLASLPVGSRVPLTGPLGRPFALPKEPVNCLLVGDGHGAAPIFALGERLRERGCRVSVLLAAADEAHLLPTRDVRGWARSVTVVTGDGSVGARGVVAGHLDDAFRRAEADVVYAGGPREVLRQVAAAAEREGAWSQVALEEPTPCGTGLCHGCPLPVVGEDGVERTVRACTEGPVLRGDRVRWSAW